MTSCNKKERANKCPCTYCDENGKSCVHKGKCCACIAHHRRNNELPACYFSPGQEKTYDRSIKNYLESNGLGCKCSCGEHKDA